MVLSDRARHVEHLLFVEIHLVDLGGVLLHRGDEGLSARLPDHHATGALDDHLVFGHVVPPLVLPILALAPCCYLVTIVLRVFLTGRVALDHAGAVTDESALAGRLGRTILVRLALHPHPVDRDRLVEEMWPDGAPRGVDSVLNATFSRLRAALGDIGVDGRAVLRSQGGVAEFRPPAGTRIDVMVATTAIDAAEGALRRGEPGAAWSGAVVAHSIAQRPLLPGVDRVWLDPERNRLQQVLERSFSVLADVWLQRGDPQQSVTMARELVRLARYSEAAHRRLVVALLAADDRAAAAHAVAQWESVLVDELGLVDDGRLRTLVSAAPGVTPRVRG